jgi:hypothetical protein
MGITIGVYTSGGLGSLNFYHAYVSGLNSQISKTILPKATTKYGALRYAVLFLIRQINDTVLNKTNNLGE